MWSNFGPVQLAILPKKPLNGAARVTPSWTETAKQLDRFGNEYCEDDWDGQGATAIPEELLDSACRLATHLEERGVAAPTWTLAWFDGTVIFEWNSEDGSRIEIELTASNVAEISATTSNGFESHRVLCEGVPAI